MGAERLRELMTKRLDRALIRAVGRGHMPLNG
jgi:hypothetical protein